MATLPLETKETTTARVPIFSIVVASALGSSIEWSDFFYYSFLSVTVFPALFFPRLDPATGIVASFAANFIGFVARPLGGILFGRVGDRVGRKSTLAATLLLIGTTTMLMGVLPGYDTLGIAAPLLLSLLRFLQGVGVGGEWGGSVLMTMECCDQRHRGFWTSWPQLGVPCGLLLSTSSILLFKYLYPGEAFQSVGWRMPFLLSTMLVVVGLYIRLRLPETPVFERTKAREQAASQSPGAPRLSWRNVLLSALVRCGEQAPFYIFTTFALNYGMQILHLDASLLYTGLIVAASISLFTIPAFSVASDRVGRRTTTVCGALAMMCLVIPFFILINTRNPLLVIMALALALGCPHACLYGPQASLIAERFPTRVRYTGASMGYQLASIIAGGPAPIIATYLLANTSLPSPLFSPGSAWGLIALYIIVSSLLTLLAALALKEYAGHDAEEEPVKPIH
ncbi:MAG TPA: MFS transporter [Ktedonobacteraceae bacterium]|nr:MFS transporter [Ktedonobacteraceae bacterium]